MPSLERRHKHFVTDTSESADGQFRVDVILLWAVIEVIPASAPTWGIEAVHQFRLATRSCGIANIRLPAACPFQGARPSQDRPLLSG